MICIASVVEHSTGFLILSACDDQVDTSDVDKTIAYVDYSEEALLPRLERPVNVV